MVSSSLDKWILWCDSLKSLGIKGPLETIQSISSCRLELVAFALHLREVVTDCGLQRPASQVSCLLTLTFSPLKGPLTSWAKWMEGPLPFSLRRQPTLKSRGLQALGLLLHLKKREIWRHDSRLLASSSPQIRGCLTAETRSIALVSPL